MSVTGTRRATEELQPWLYRFQAMHDTQQQVQLQQLYVVTGFVYSCVKAFMTAVSVAL
jgi:hypothetical protein